MTKMIIMGVSGAGKSTLGAALAGVLGWHFLDADDFHTTAAKSKIASGVALDEVDRAAWLSAISPNFSVPDKSIVLACSALKAIHRASLKHDILVHLVIEPGEAIARLTVRENHFAGPEIAPSQFQILELPEDAISIPAMWTTQKQVNHVIHKLKALNLWPA